MSRLSVGIKRLWAADDRHWTRGNIVAMFTLGLLMAAIAFASFLITLTRDETLPKPISGVIAKLGPYERAPSSDDLSGITSGYHIVTQARTRTSQEEWAYQSVANPAGTVDVLVHMQNAGTERLNNVVVRAELPQRTTLLVPSTFFAHGQAPRGIPASDNVAGVGLNIGDYLSEANAYVKFSLVVAPDSEFSCGYTTLPIRVFAETDYGSEQADTVIRVSKECHS